MNIKIHSLKFDADAKLLEFVEAKVKKLNQFYENILNAEVTLRIDKSENLENKVADIKIEIPGNDLFSKRQEKTFEQAIDLAVEAMRRQLKKTKEKQRGN